MAAAARPSGTASRPLRRAPGEGSFSPSAGRDLCVRMRGEIEDKIRGAASGDLNEWRLMTGPNRVFEAYRAFHDQVFMPIFVEDGYDSKLLIEACVAAGMKGIEYTLRR